jgi:hypothetical protein
MKHFIDIGIAYNQRTERLGYHEEDLLPDPANGVACGVVGIAPTISKGYKRANRSIYGIGEIKWH